MCVHVHLLCALLSLLRKYRANNFISDIAALFQRRTLNTSHILDFVATLSILAVHLAGHHDVIDRILRRLGWLGRGLQRCVRWLGGISLKLLDEVPSDLEDQSDQSLQQHKVSAKQTRSFSPSTTTYSTNGLFDAHNQKAVELTGTHIDDPSGDELPGRFRQMRRVSPTFIRKEIRSFGAQVRWSTVRYAFGFQDSPFQDASLLVTILGQAFEPMFGSDNLGNFQTGLQFPHRDGIAHRSSSSITSAVMDAVDRKKPFGITQLPRQGFEGIWGPTVNSHGANRPPSMQLPGTLGIQRTSVKALPDTGSSQNVIDSAFMQTSFPAVTVECISPIHDKPLVAPDGEIIPCTGKVYLPWAFKKEEAKVYYLWFYVVENCLHDVIIGNGFLKETQTFEKHYRERVEINIRSDLELLPENLVSGAQESSCRRQIMSGIVNGQSVDVSLDTGCEANLMSAGYAKERGLNPIPLPGGNQEIKYANGRTGSTLGRVEVDWSFDDDPPGVAVKVWCYVLPVCVHSIIFGAQFALSENPWEKHSSTLNWKELPDTGDAGVVGLVEETGSRLLSVFGKKRPNPQDDQIRKENKAQHDRLAAMLSSPSSPTHPTPALSTPPSVGTLQPVPAAAAGLSLSSQPTNTNQLNGHTSLAPSAAVVGAAAVASTTALSPSIAATSSQSISSPSSGIPPAQPPVSSSVL